MDLATRQILWQRPLGTTADHAPYSKRAMAGDLVALMGDLLNVVERSKENLLLAEEYIAREGLGEEGEDPTAPPPAGGA